MDLDVGREAVERLVGDKEGEKMGLQNVCLPIPPRPRFVSGGGLFLPERTGGEIWKARRHLWGGGMARTTYYRKAPSRPGEHIHPLQSRGGGAPSPFPLSLPCPEKPPPPCLLLHRDLAG